MRETEATVIPSVARNLGREILRFARDDRLRSTGWALALCLLAACGGPGSPAEARVERARGGDGPVTVAAVWPWDAHPEVRYAEGLEMAVEEVNASGGIGGRPLRL